MSSEKKIDESLLQKVKEIGDAFENSTYFKVAEHDMNWEWDYFIWPMIKNLDLSCVLDLAAGYGRNSVKLKDHAKKIIIVDIREDCIKACQQRFKGDERFVFIKNDGLSLAGVYNNTVSLIYSFDSMVHFHKDVIRKYIKEFYRVLKPGGYGFCHHSNYSEKPGSTFTENPHWRSDMSQELFEKFCNEANLEVVQYKIIDWGGHPKLGFRNSKLDCLTLFKKPIQ